MKEKDFLIKVLPNVVTILIVAVMLLVNRVLAEPNGSPVMQSGGMDQLSYQGTLLDGSGEPVDGYRDITFRIYNHPTDVTSLWEEVHSGANAVPVNSGLFNVLLGSLNPIPDTIWNETDIYLGVQVASDSELAPRELINLLPPQIAPGSLDANMLKPGSMDYMPFHAYQLSYGDEINFHNYSTGMTTYIDPDTCAVNDNWCCNSENTICLRRNPSGEDILSLRLNDSHSDSCWLVHSDDDFPTSSNNLSYSTDHDGQNTPFQTPGNVFYFMRPGANDIPIAHWATYKILCLD